MAESKLNPRELARQEELKKKKKARAKYVWIGVALVLVIALVVFVNSPLFTNGLAALKVGDKGYTVADVNYEYQSSYMQFTQTYGSYLSSFLDTSKPLSEQECMFDADGGTWDDYFKKSAEQTLIQKTAFGEAARKAGYTLSEEDLAAIDSAISNYALYAGLYNYTVDGYLAANFGAGNNEKTVRAHMEEEALINGYLEQLYDSYEFTDEELEAEYTENKNDYDRVSVSYVNVAAAEGVDPKQITEDIAAAAADGTEEDFNAAAEAAGQSVTHTSYSVSGFLNQYGESVTAEDLREGLIFTHQTDNNGYAVYVEGLEDNDYHTVSVRHILIKAVDADGDGSYSEEELNAAAEQVVAIQAEWLANGGDEAAFEELARTRSEDAGSAENGGLYEEIYKGQMVEEFDAFCFADHKPGDYAIVKGESSSYAGYHLIYFVSADGPLYKNVLAENSLRSAKYNAETSALTEGLEATRTFMWRYVMNNQ